MKALISYLDNNPKTLYWACFILAIPALFLNLGLLPISADEPTRAVVAMEMIFSDNYWVPKINDVYYYNKPPLFNWLLIGTFKVTGNMNELSVRLPSVIPLLLYGLTIFLWVKRFLSAKTAFLSAAMFVTCGRMLIYASLLGHIDIFYSWITFFSFIVMIECLKKEQWLKLFVITYLISSVAFLSKGLPTVLFQGLSLGALFLVHKRFKKLFSWQHLCGLALFTAIVGGYFYMYSLHNSVDGWINTLWSQSAERTAADKAWYETLLHIFKFPIDHFYHLAPWSLFVIFLFRKAWLKSMWDNYYFKSLMVIFAINIPVYWLSPGYFPRYLFMLYPILFILLSHSYFSSDSLLKHKVVRVTFFIFAILLCLFAFTPFVLNVEAPFIIVKSGLVLILGLICLTLFKLQQHQYVAFVMILLCFRIGFDWFVLPHRLTTGRTLEYKTDPIKIAIDAGDQNIQIYDWTPVNHGATYYIERTTQRLLPLRKGFAKNTRHIADKAVAECYKKYKTVGHFTIRYENRELYVIETPTE